MATRYPDWNDPFPHPLGKETRKGNKFSVQDSRISWGRSWPSRVKKYYTDLQFLDQASQVCCDLVSLSGPRTSQGPSRFVGTRRPPSCDRSLAVPGKTRSTDAWWLLRYYFGGPPGQPPSRSQVLKHLVQLQNSPLSTQTQLYSPAQTLCGLTPHSRPSS